MAIVNKNIALAIAALAACGTRRRHGRLRPALRAGLSALPTCRPRSKAAGSSRPTAYFYSGNIRGTQVAPTDLSAVVGAPAGSGALGAQSTIRTNTQINVYGLLPRLSFMSAHTFLGATSAAPRCCRSSTRAATPASPASRRPSTARHSPLVPAANAGDPGRPRQRGRHPVGRCPDQRQSNVKTCGIGDLEISPILRWSTEATQTLFVMTVVAPTGDYDPTRAANPSAGKFWTFRPAVQFSYIGDGWDVGARVAYSYNTRNTLHQLQERQLRQH